MTLPRRIRGVIFDMDGTLCLPQAWMFDEFRTAVGLPVDSPVDVLTHLASLSPTSHAKANANIEAVEARAMIEMEPQPGLTALMLYLETRGIPRAIVTRNKMGPVRHLTTLFIGPNHGFDPIVTRDFLPTKPHPAPLLFVISHWGNILPLEVMMVGDSIDDMEAGSRAGCITTLVEHARNGHLKGQVDHLVQDLAGVVAVLDQYTL